MCPRSPPSVQEKVQTHISRAFSDAQRTTASHPRATKLLLTAYQISPKFFLSSFIQALNRILIIFSRDPPVERLIQFVARFASSHTDATGNFCATILTYLTYHSNARVPAVRFRTLQLIATILYLLPRSAELSDQVIDPLQKAVFHRSDDRVPRVRAAAAGALCRMQTTANPDDDQCTARLIQMLTSDTSAAVRKAALQAVALNNLTIPFALSRIRDINPDVRRVAFHTVAEKNVDPYSLDNQLVISTLRQGLNDRVKTVRDACRDKLLVSSWIDHACNGNIFKLVDLLGCQQNEREVLNVLKVIFESPKCSNLLDTVQIDVNNLTRDDVLILRALHEAGKADNGIDKFISTTSTYAQILSYYAIDAFASKHLLELAKCVDMSDEAGRKTLQQVIRSSFLTSSQVGHEITASAIAALRKTEGDEQAFTRLCTEIGQDVLTLEATEDARFDQNDSNNEEIEWRRIRALYICREALRYAPQSATGASTINVLYRNMLLLLVDAMSEVEEIRYCSMECIGLFSLLDKSGQEARKNAPLLVQACAKDVSCIQQLALQVLVDMSMLFDLAVQDSNSEEPKTAALSSPSLLKIRTTPDNRSSITEQCLDLLIENLEHEDSVMRTIAAQGLARLLIVRRLTPTATLLQKLLITFHIPTTEDDVELRQYLSMFFPIFAYASSGNRIALEGAFKETLHFLMHAPEDSELRNISMVQVAQFIISLTTPPQDSTSDKEDNIGGPAELIHERLAEWVLCYLVQDPEVFMPCCKDIIVESRVFVKLISSFRLDWSPTNEPNLRDVRKLLKTAAADCEDPRSKTTLSKLAIRIEGEIEQNKPDQEESDQEPEELTEDAK